jgi:4-amino-4-deoxy-L-arabinose transferase-like glycosyltransferase
MLKEHHAIAGALTLFVVLGLIYSTMTPLFEAPDEQWHFAFVQHVATGRGLPVQSEQPTHLARQEGSQPPLYYLLAAGITFWIDTTDFPGIVWENPHYGYTVPGVVNDNKNLFIHTALENFPWRGAVLAIHLARFVSLAMGALAVLFTYLLALEIFRDKILATMAGVFVAFVPQFIFISGAVSNDSTVVACAAFTLWLMARQLTNDRRPATETLALGLACGLAAIAKVSGLGLLVLAGMLLLWQLRQTNFSRTVFLNFLFFIFSFLLVAGWWYIRNMILYGELTGTAMMSRIFHVRPTPLTLSQLGVQLREVWETFWLGLGWGNIRAHPIIYSVIEIAMIVAMVGLAIGLLRWRKDFRNASFVMLGLWGALMFGAMIYWMQTTQAPHGRLLFPALPAFAVLFTFGLARIHLYVLRFTSLALLFLSALTPIVYLQPAYAFPPTLTETALPSTLRRVEIDYASKMRLIGYEVTSRRALPGESITLSLYWQSLAPMDEDYSIGIHLVDANGRVIGARDSYPGKGMLPTRLWRAGQIIRDDFWLPINGDAVPGAARLHVSMYQRETKHDLPARDPSGAAITPIIGQIKIAAANPVIPAITNPTYYNFDQQIALIGYDLKRVPSLDLTLYWKRLAPIQTDYTVFVHVIDANGTIIAQRDQPPANGNNPTSLWDDGEIVSDLYSLALPSNPAKPIRVIVGLYEAGTGARLPVTNQDGATTEYVELDLIR